VHIATDLPDVHAPEVAVRQILDVLIGNALQHGAGTVAVTVNRLGDGVAIDVSDEGPGFAMASGAASRSTHAARGLGLPLARSLTQLAGGSLVEADIGPAPVLRLLLPSSRLEPGRVDAVQEPAS
jgi:signal transduction histidine kinase